MKIVSVDNVYIYPEHVSELKRLGDVVIYHDIPNKQEGIRRIQDADIVIDSWFEMPATVIKALSRVKMITVAATGYDWVDLSETTKRGIMVCNAPGYSTEAVAEHTIGLILRAIRLGSQAEHDLRCGKWNPAEYKGKELENKTLGIIGYGAIGRRVASIAKMGFKMQILYVNSRSTKKEFEHLLAESDVISINAPLTKATKGIVGTKEFQLMKQGIIIVNTGRGAIINQDALMNNLKSGKVFSAGLDVFVKEPLEQNNPLLNFPNVTLTAHIGWNTEESEYRLSHIVVENIKSFLRGKPQNIIK